MRCSFDKYEFSFDLDNKHRFELMICVIHVIVACCAVGSKFHLKTNLLFFL